MPEQPIGRSGEADLGVLLTTRSDGIVQRFMLALIGIALGFFGAAMIVSALAPGGTPITGGTVAVMLVVGVFAIWLAWLCAKGVLGRTHFHEFGVRRTMLGRVVAAVEYDRAKSLSYSVTRRYTNGIYTGTDVALGIEPMPIGGKKGKRLSFHGKHKEKPDGALSRTFIAKNFKGEDELDAIKNIVAAAIARRWIASGEFREKWCGSAVLTPRGFEFDYGSRIGTRIPYSEIQRVTRDGTYIRVYVPVDKPGFIIVPSDGTNFWPGLELVTTMLGGKLPTGEASESGPPLPGHAAAAAGASKPGSAAQATES